MEEKAKGSKMPNKQQPPKLNNAFIKSTGSYFILYDIQEIDYDRKVYKGRPVPLMAGGGNPGPLPDNAVEVEWIFFSREYDDRNDWDRLYHEIIFEDEELIGAPFSVVPKEKILFKYNSPTTIILPKAQVGKIRRN